MAITPKQRRFVQELMVDECASAAAIRAGYSPRSAQTNGPRLTRIPEVRAAIQEARKAVAERAQLRADEVLAELRRILFVDPRQAFDAEGRPIPVHKLPADVARALAGCELRGEDEGGGVKKWKWWDKPKALELAMRHLGMLVDKTELSGPGGEPLEIQVNLVTEGGGDGE